MQSICDARCAIGATNDTYVYRSANAATGHARDGFDTVLDSKGQGSIQIDGATPRVAALMTGCLVPISPATQSRGAFGTGQIP